MRRGRVRTACVLGAWGLTMFLGLAAAVSAAPPSQPNLGPDEIIVQKDPFDPERGRNAQTQEASNIPGADELKKTYIVYGTFISDGIRKAVIRVMEASSVRSFRPGVRKPRGEMRVFREGDTIKGWRIVGISGQGVELESGGNKVDLKIFGEEKAERKAGAPVAIQTPQVLPVMPAPAASSAGQPAAPAPQPQGPTPAPTQPTPTPQARQSNHPVQRQPILPSPARNSSNQGGPFQLMRPAR